MYGGDTDHGGNLYPAFKLSSCPTSHSGGHWDAVTAGFVAEPWHWQYSSAIEYFTEKSAAGYYYFGWLLGSEISNREDTGWNPAPVGY